MKGFSAVRGRKARFLRAIGACALGLALAPAAASATTIYVDAVNGSDFNGCASPADACQSIAVGVLLAQATETVQVESGTYGHFSLPRGKSVVAAEFNANNADPQPVIQGGSSDPAVTVNASAQPPGSIEGFVINGAFSSMDIADSITVRNNVFNEDAPATRPAFVGADVHVTGGTVVFRNNTFDDPLPIDEQFGIAISGGSVTVDDNDFDGLREAIDATGVLNLAITANTITGLHQADVTQPGDPPTFTEGFGVVAIDSSSTIGSNLIHEPAVGGVPVGIYLNDSDTTTDPDSNAVLRRNRVFGLERAVFVSGAGPGSSISLEGDLLANNSGFGLAFSSFDLPLGLLSVTGATIYGNGVDVELFAAAMTMDSTAIEDPISIPAADSTCAITNSRGPTTSGSSCQTFQTSAAPAFANPLTNDFHLLSSSPLIDAGNPAAPPGGSVDIDGDARALDGNCDGSARRDIGADEVVRDCTPPQTTIDSGPSGTTDVATPSFGFSSSEPGSSFRCGVDGAALAPCSGPGDTHTTAALGEGSHTFRVVATDGAGNADPTPAERQFNVDLPDARDITAPETSITKGPKRKSTDRTPTFKFGSDEAGVTFQCRLDRKPYASCSSTKNFRARPGRHSVSVYAVDAAGNADATPAKRSFKIVERR